MSSFIPKKRALHDTVNEAADPVVVGAGLFDQAIHFLPIGELDFASCRVDDQVRDDIAGDILLLREQVSFEFTNSRKRFALRGHAARINAGPFPVFIDPPSEEFALRAIAFSS